MKSSTGSNLKYSLYIPIVDSICELQVNDYDCFIYFKKRFHSLSSSSKVDFRIIFSRNVKEFAFLSQPEGIESKIDKKFISSLEEIYFILIALMQHEALKYNIIFLHASSCIQKNKAYLFIAPSGSGKSTIIKTLPAKQILSDDIAMLKKVDNSFYAFSSPLDKKKGTSFHSNNARVHSLFFIKQASFTKHIPQDTGETLNGILNSNIFFWYRQLQKEQMRKVYNKPAKKLYTLALDLIKYSKIETLYFTKDLHFSSLISV